MTKTTNYITLKQAAKLLPTRPSRQAVWRWAKKGIRGRDGSIVKLRHAMFGSTIMTTPEWLGEFGSQLAEAHEAIPSTFRPKIPTKAEAMRIIDEL